jgi:hypothetical protein
MKVSLRGIQKVFGMTKQSQKARFLAEFIPSGKMRFFAPLRMTSEGLGMTV